MASWSPYIGEELPVQREVKNIHDDFAAVLKNSSTVGHVPREISRVYWYFLHKSDSEMICSHKLTKDSLYSTHLQRNWAHVVNIIIPEDAHRGALQRVKLPYAGTLVVKSGGGATFEGGVLAGHYGTI